MLKKTILTTRTGMVENPSFFEKTVNIILVFIAGAVAFCSFIPMWHVLMASLSDGKSLLAHSGLLILPVGDLTLDGYQKVFSSLSILKGYGNTLIYVVGSVSFGMIFNILGGYVLSRSSILQKPLTILVLFSVLFNGGLIPTYIVVKTLGWVGTRWALLIPGCTNGMFVIMMMNAFRIVPESTVEAARIDGANHLQTLFKVMLPQTKSMATVIILNSTLIQWNNWFPAAIYMPNKRELWPLQLWIKQIVAENEAFFNNANPDYGRYLVQYALIIIATLPVLIAFPFFQEQLEKGVLGGAVKG